MPRVKCCWLVLLSQCSVSKVKKIVTPFLLTVLSFPRSSENSGLIMEVTTETMGTRRLVQSVEEPSELPRVA